MQEPLLSLLGPLADTDAADAILEGTFVPPCELDEYTKLLILHMKRPDGVPEVSTESLYLSKEQLCKDWKTQKATTGCETTGPPFSHQIVACQNKLVAEVFACLHSVPCEMGFPGRPFMKITDVAIPKKVDSIDVTDLRFLQLMNTFFNMNNKRMGRSMMSHAEKYDMLAPEQYGSRKRHKSIDAALNKVLTSDISRQKRLPMVLLSNDAEQCYDRMNHSPTALAM